MRRSRAAPWGASWQLGLRARFERARIRPLQDQRHAYNTFHYTHRQDARHDLALDLHREATSLPDLLGLRVLGTSLAARVRAYLPRVRRDDLLTHFPEGTFDDGAAIDLDVLPDAAAAALALPDLDVRSVDAARARRAAVHAAGPEVPSTVLAERLGVCVRAVQASRRHPVDPTLVRAVRLQAALRARARSCDALSRSAAASSRRL